MNLETQRSNIVHRILAIENEQLLNQIEELINNDVYCYTTKGKPLTTKEYKTHLTEIMKVSEESQESFSTAAAKKKIVRK
jgi:hypothetical protein